MLEELKEKVCKANIELSNRNIVIYTWGNVSAISTDRKYIVIKPSGVNYEELKESNMVVVDVMSGQVVEGNLRPSSDTATHLELYRAFRDIKAVVHTHSTYATAFAQAGMPIRALGTTHADYFYGEIPCTRELSKQEVEIEYEANTGRVIVETILQKGYNPLVVPGILVKNHGPFAWGEDASNAVHNAVVMEKIAEIGINTLLLNPMSKIDKYVLDKHYNRKHGNDAYYGQKQNI